MRILVLGGTAWLGGEIVREALRRGHEVTALARGDAGSVPEGAAFVRADRDELGAYDEVAGAEWDAVVDVSRQPGHVRGAIASLAERVRHWVFVSTCSVYEPRPDLHADESAPILRAYPGDLMTDPEQYGAAKVACEEAVRAAFGDDRAFVARASLIGGPGDASQRSTYWPTRFAHPSNPEGRVLVPDAPEVLTQVIDVRDLAAFLVDAAERRHPGTANVGGETLTLAEHLATAQRVAGWSGQLIAADEDWLAEHGVDYWAGPRSLPLWLRGEHIALGSHDTTRAERLGLRRRPLEETLRDGAAWETARTGPVERRAGLSDDDERALLEELEGL
ncbi:NAD-dependent epimerase/dehydratase family protein [Pseudolysinimonas sp.]|uniref:NAD-dependent epimerase/dehydratase family protein n=1 Tax=Pseudolysinimonas sp. TaxID=2680009 RepID=UPI003F7D9ABF